MRKLLNTLYITDENYYLARERQNIVIKDHGDIVSRFPIHILEGIVCFSYVGASPQVVELCNANNISITFLTPTGRFCGKFIGLTNGNVLLRRQQYRLADDCKASLKLAKWFIKGKLINSRKMYIRLLHDHSDRINKYEIQKLIDNIAEKINRVDLCTNPDELRGIEGDVARLYFMYFDNLILQQKDEFTFWGRTKRPPLDRVNAVLSFLYSILTYEIQAALETVGLDSYVGFFHTDRPGRASLALDLIEELRAFLVDRFVITMINLRQIVPKDFLIKESGAVLLNKQGRNKVLREWQKRKNKEIYHHFIKEDMPIGLVPYVQAQLLARYLKNDIDFYPPFIA